MKRSVLISLPAFVAVGILGASALGLGAYIDAQKIRLTKLPIYPPEGRQFRAMATRFDGWERYGTDDIISGDTLKTLGTENYLTRRYAQTDVLEGERRHSLSLHLAYYTGTIDTVPHVPERCLVGAGWQIEEKSKIIRIPLTFTDEHGHDVLVRDTYVESSKGDVWLTRDPDTGRRRRLPREIENLRMNVTQFRNADGSVNLYAGYFFIANGVIYPKSELVRLNAYRLENDYAFYAKIQFSSMTVGSAEELAEIAADFLDNSFHEIMRLLPDWVEVEDGRYPP